MLNPATPLQRRALGDGESFGEVAVFAYRTWNLNKEHAELLGNATALEGLCAPAGPARAFPAAGAAAAVRQSRRRHRARGRLRRTADVICVEASVLLEITAQVRCDAGLAPCGRPPLRDLLRSPPPPLPPPHSLSIPRALMAEC